MCWLKKEKERTCAILKTSSSTTHIIQKLKPITEKRSNSGIIPGEIPLHRFFAEQKTVAGNGRITNLTEDRKDFLAIYSTSMPGELLEKKQLRACWTAPMIQQVSIFKRKSGIWQRQYAKISAFEEGCRETRHPFDLR